VAELRPHLSEMRRKGANVAIVGNGLPAMAKGFVERLGLSGEARVLTDPKRQSYKLAGFRRGVWATLGPRALVNLLRALRKRLGTGKIEGDAWQQGGTMVIARGGEVLFRYASQYQGDHTQPEKLLAALGT
jgi:AhpC/TSA antioxidant enzyme